MLEGDPPTFDIALTHFIVSDDVERARRFYTEDYLGRQLAPALDRQLVRKEAPADSR